MADKIELIGLDKDEISALRAEIGEKAVPSQAVVSMAVCSGATSFEQMTNLSKDFTR